MRVKFNNVTHNVDIIIKRVENGFEFVYPVKDFIKTEFTLNKDDRWYVFIQNYYYYSYDSSRRNNEKTIFEGPLGNGSILYEKINQYKKIHNL